MMYADYSVAMVCYPIANHLGLRVSFPWRMSQWRDSWKGLHSCVFIHVDAIMFSANHVIHRTAIVC